jgi:hypothetical protein
VFAAISQVSAADTNSMKSAGALPLTLAQALKTNSIGTYKISPPWTGKCDVAYASGAFQRSEPRVFATNRYDLKFDLAVIPPKNAIGNVGPKAVARTDTNGGYRALHSYRESLPVDAKIKSVSTVGGLERVLGHAQGFPAATGYGPEARTKLTWSLFALADGTLDTLQVSAVVQRRSGGGDDRVEAIEIVRGTARPEIKRSDKKS